MKETKFILQNKEKWAEYEKMLGENNRDPEKLNELFVQITDDLSYARTFYPRRSVRIYLNGLARRIFHNIYRGKRFPVERLRLFWSETLPQLLWEHRKAVYLSFAVFALAFTVGWVSSVLNPEFARVILGDGYVEMTLTNIEKGDPMAVYKDDPPLGMSIGIALNNLYVGFLTAILGVFTSIGTVFIMLFNGIMVGAFQAFFFHRGVGIESMLTIWIHGTLEISAIILAGASGIVAGSGLLFPGTFSRMQAFQLSVRRGLSIFFGLTPIIILAALFEGFLTRYTDTPAFLRAAFIGLNLFFVVWYFLWLPWHKSRTTGFPQPFEDKRLSPEDRRQLDYTTLKSSGEILSEAFTFCRKFGGPLIAAVGFGSVVFLLGALFFSTEKLRYAFDFPKYSGGILSTLPQFFENAHSPRLFYIQTLIAAVFAALLLGKLENDRQKTLGIEANKPAGATYFRRFVSLCVLAAFFAFAMIVPTGFLRWLFALWALPFIGFCAAVVVVENKGIVGALWRTIRLARWRRLTSVGFLIVNFGFLLFLFLDWDFMMGGGRQSSLWGLAVNLFSWLIPPGEGHMETYETVISLLAGEMMLLFVLGLILISGVFHYLTDREIKEAVHLHEGIDKIGQKKLIRGLPRE